MKNRKVFISWVVLLVMALFGSCIANYKQNNEIKNLRFASYSTYMSIITESINNINEFDHSGNTQILEQLYTRFEILNTIAQNYLGKNIKLDDNNSYYVIPSSMLDLMIRNKTPIQTVKDYLKIVQLELVDYQKNRVSDTDLPKSNEEFAKCWSRILNKTIQFQKQM